MRASIVGKNQTVGRSGKAVYDDSRTTMHDDHQVPLYEVPVRTYRGAACTQRLWSTSVWHGYMGRGDVGEWRRGRGGYDGAMVRCMESYNGIIVACAILDPG